MLEVKLISKPSVAPTDIIAASARTCYSNRGLILPEEVTNWDKKTDLLNSLFNARHYTTFQHSYITLGISNISRHLVYKLLHNHSNYTSEQISQRYVNANKNLNFVYPNTTDYNKLKWEEYYNKVLEYYNILYEELINVFEKLMPVFKKDQIPKKAQEFARYVLPQGITTSLYHTINIITALKYIAVAKSLPEANDEAILFAKQLSKILIELDPELETFVNRANNINCIYPILKNSNEILNNYRKNAINSVLVFSISGSVICTENDSYSNILDLYTVLTDGGILGSINTYFEISLSADAQNQRHRTSPAFRPNLKDTFEYGRYYVPEIIATNDNILKIYEKAMKYMYDFFMDQIETHEGTVDFGEAVYALPNAHLTDIIQKDDFSNLIHKGHMRLCLNSQEEIRKLIVNQIEQISKKITNKDYLNKLKQVTAPCIVRYNHNIRPYCPEGNRYCGVKVWNMDKNELFETLNRYY